MQNSAIINNENYKFILKILLCYLFFEAVVTKVSRELQQNSTGPTKNMIMNCSATVVC